MKILLANKDFHSKLFLYLFYIITILYYYSLFLFYILYYYYFSESDFDRRIPNDIRGDLEARMKEREELMRTKFERDREHILKDRRGFDPKSISPDGDFPEDPSRHEYHRHSPEDLHRIHKDISERHQELIDHRQKVYFILQLFFSLTLINLFICRILLIVLNQLDFHQKKKLN